MIVASLNTPIEWWLAIGLRVCVYGVRNLDSYKSADNVVSVWIAFPLTLAQPLRVLASITVTFGSVPSMASALRI